MLVQELLANSLVQSWPTETISKKMFGSEPDSKFPVLTNHGEFHKNKKKIFQYKCQMTPSQFAHHIENVVTEFKYSPV